MWEISNYLHEVHKKVKIEYDKKHADSVMSSLINYYIRLLIDNGVVMVGSIKVLLMVLVLVLP